MNESFFIAFEGLDGSGKTTQAQLLSEKLKSEGLNLYPTAEPTASPIGKLIKDIFHHKMEADHRTIAALYAADRLHHLTNNIDGLLKKHQEGYTIVSDRYYFSSYAYHSVYMDMEWVIQINALSAGMLRPDLTIYIDVPPDVCMRRLNKNRETVELYESTENLKRVREKYFEAFDRFRNEERIAIIDGLGTAEEISRRVWNETRKIIQIKI